MLTVSCAQLEDRVKELEHLLSEASRDCDMKSKECEQEREAHTILQTENNELKKSLTQKEELLEVTLADAEKKQQKDVEAIASLEADKFYMIDILKRMKNTMKLFGNLLYKTQKDCEQEREAHIILQAENNELKKTFTQKDELLKVFVAEAQEEHQRVQEAITQLESEKSDLKEQVKTLRDTVQDLGDLLYQTQTECDDLTEECEREREAHTTLQAERDVIKKTLTLKEKFPEEQESEAHTILQAENDKMKVLNQKEELEKPKVNYTFIKI
ncbi:uncharacterized protein Hap1MRO34_020608 [Clarias gariepinus]|uniref:leucine-rich repeat flightless-interacting protein 1-like n=1 Tax=Clarias gariepinus TaxID=13013 RepID=UPI00234D848B|nr:leucine-rich repeat flightless-interacting protein 1-like [Clarias gariepinus]